MRYWHLYDAKTLKLVEPRRIGDRTQRDIVREVVEKLKSYDTVILVLSPGCGKTSISLSTAYEVAGPEGKVVYNSGPYVVRQVQIVEDYCGGRFLIGDGENFWRISPIFGRQNYRCPRTGRPCSEAPCRDPAERATLPCYSPPRRVPVGERCVSWTGIDGKSWFLDEDAECPYFAQFRAYAEANVIVLNSFMWIHETEIGRKVQADVEIIDEFDAVLQQLQPRVEIYEEHVNALRRLVKELGYRTREEAVKHLRKIRTFFRRYVRECDLPLLVHSFIDLVNILLDTYPPDVFMDDPDLEEVLNIYSKLRHVKNDLSSYAIYQRAGRVVIYSTRPRSWYRHLLERKCAPKRILMSGTVPYGKLLEQVYGLDDVAIIEVGRGLPGKVYLGATFGIPGIGRYLRARRENYYEKYVNELVITIKIARMDGHAPRIIIITSRTCLEIVEKHVPQVVIDYDGTRLREFLEGKLEEVATTRALRAVDLPGDKCRSIVITKAPFPDLDDPWWHYVKKILGEAEFELAYRHEAKNNLLQIIGRALRSEDDWVWIYSPDRYVLELLLELEREGRIRLIRDVVPETRRIVQEILSKVEHEGIASVELPNNNLRSRIKHILETWFSCITYEVENYLIIVHRARQHELEQLAKQLLDSLRIESQAQPTTLQDSPNIDNNIRNIDKNIDKDWQGSRRSNSLSMKENTLIIVQFKQDCLHYRKGDIVTLDEEVLEQCRDRIDILDL